MSEKIADIESHKLPESTSETLNNAAPYRQQNEEDTEQKRSIPRGQIISLILSMSSVIVVAVMIFFNIFTGGNLIYFEEVDLPSHLTEIGIKDSYIKSHLIDEINSMNDSVVIKIKSILSSQTYDDPIRLEKMVAGLNSSNLVVSGDEQIMASGTFITFNIANISKKLRKSLTSHNDVALSIYFTINEDQLTMHYTAEENIGGKISGRHTATLSDFDSPADCVNSLLSMAAANVAGFYSPLAMVLKDYHPIAETEVYEQLSPWGNSIVPYEKKKQVLNIKTASDDTSASKWRDVVMGSLYENIGYTRNSITDIQKAITSYRSLAKADADFEYYAQRKIEDLTDFSRLLKENDSSISLLLEDLLSNPKYDLAECQQLIVVVASPTIKTKASMYRLQKNEYSGWTQIDSIYDVNLGARGLATEQQKVEGDNRTPEGLYSITRAFGYRNDINTRLPFITLTPNHVWVTDPTDSLYNRIVIDRKNQYLNRSEKLLRNDRLNKYAIIVDYNTDSIIPGKGSAIFIHCERSRQHRTAGCISLPEHQLVRMIEWLDPDLRPHIYIRS